MRNKIKKNLMQTLIMTGTMLVCLGGCSTQPIEENLPPGVAYLQNTNRGKGFHEFIEEALRESEMFRRRLLHGQDKDLINTKLLAGVIDRFCNEATAYLKGRKGIDGFKLSERDLREAIEGKETLNVRRVYGGFTGKWYGKWEQMRVDHHWGPIVEYDRPRRIEIFGHKPVYLRSYQYCWVGDGYGLNVVASDEAGNNSRDFLLGYVTHVRQGDMSKPTKSRPHVGIYAGQGKLIWITAGEIFLEESYEITAGVDAYVITGFFYKVKDNSLETTECFQAKYTRNRDNRPEWFSFPLKLKVNISKK